MAGCNRIVTISKLNITEQCAVILTVVLSLDKDCVWCVGCGSVKVMHFESETV